MAIQPERPEGTPETDTVDASINARLTRHLMENAAKRQDAPASPERPSLGMRLLVGSGIAFLMSIVGLYSLLDRKQRYL